MKTKSQKVDISVIVSVFNQELYIGRCIRSLLDQKSFPGTYEIIVIDDCSDDRTNYALSQFGASIKVIRNTKNLGLAKSSNIGVQSAKGKFIVRVDSDDFVNAHFLLMGHQYLATNLDFCDAVAVDYYKVDDEENIISRHSADEDPIACGIFFQRKQVMDLGGYDPSFRFQEDIELRARFDKSFRMSYLHVPLYRYRRHKHNITNDKQNMKRYRNLFEKKHGK